MGLVFRILPALLKRADKSPHLPDAPVFGKQGERETKARLSLYLNRDAFY